MKICIQTSYFRQERIKAHLCTLCAMEKTVIIGIISAIVLGLFFAAIGSTTSIYAQNVTGGGGNVTKSNVTGGNVTGGNATKSNATAGGPQCKIPVLGPALPGCK